MTGLGIAQLVAWGTMYYAIAVLGQPMRRELALSDSQLFGVFAWSLALSGLLAPWAGRLVDHMGGRFVLATSSIVGACGFAFLASTSSFAGFTIAWTVIGCAMALGLYDTCFAALAQVASLDYRRKVTAVTLIAGFASTVAWPASHYLLRELAWRGTCAVYAVAMLACSPIYFFVVPAARVRTNAAESGSAASAKPSSQLQSSVRLLAVAFAGGAFIAGAFSAHLIQTLHALQVSQERAVWLAAAIGPLQVAGRFIDGLYGRGWSGLRLGQLTFGLLATSTAALLSAAAISWLVVPFVVLYGIANGLTTVAKAAIPVELFGFEKAGANIGSFSAPSLLTRAAAPFGFALLTESAGVPGALVVVALIGAASFGAFAYATRLLSTT